MGVLKNRRTPFRGGEVLSMQAEPSKTQQMTYAEQARPTQEAGSSFKVYRMSLLLWSTMRQHYGRAC